MKPNSVPSSNHLADTGTSAFTSSLRDMVVAEKQNGKDRYIIFNEMNSCVKSMGKITKTGYKERKTCLKRTKSMDSAA